MKTTYQNRILGRSELSISPLIFGAWTIGGWRWGGADESDAIAAIHAALDSGINAIDTAPVYGFGRSEELVAKAIAGRRSNLVLATKCGLRWDDNGEGSEPWVTEDTDGSKFTISRNSKPHSIRHECEESLRRLKTDYIDLYQIHRPDSSTPIEDSIAELIKLKDEGKILAIGLSNFPVSEVMKAMELTPIASQQPQFSMLTRDAEKELLPFCIKNNIGVISYSPLERGLLAGAVPPSRQFPLTDNRSNHKLFTEENRRFVLSALEKLAPLAAEKKCTLGNLMLAWTFNQPGITAAIVGARNAEQSEENTKALNVQLSATELKTIEAAFQK